MLKSLKGCFNMQVDLIGPQKCSTLAQSVFSIDQNWFVQTDGGTHWWTTHKHNACVSLHRGIKNSHFSLYEYVRLSNKLLSECFFFLKDPFPWPPRATSTCCPWQTTLPSLWTSLLFPRKMQPVSASPSRHLWQGKEFWYEFMDMLVPAVNNDIFITSYLFLFPNDLLHTKASLRNGNMIMILS